MNSGEAPQPAPNLREAMTGAMQELTAGEARDWRALASLVSVSPVDLRGIQALLTEQENQALAIIVASYRAEITAFARALRAELPASIKSPTDQEWWREFQVRPIGEALHIERDAEQILRQLGYWELANRIAGTEPILFAIGMTVLEVDTSVPFDVYTKIAGQPLVLKSAGDVFARADRDTLLERGDRQLLVPIAERNAFLGYLRERIAARFEESQTTEQHLQLGTMVARYVFEEIEDPAAEQYTRTWVQRSCKDIEAPGLFAGLMASFADRPDLYQHSVQVCLYGVSLAQRVESGVPYEEIPDLATGLLMHDIGKLRMDQGDQDHAVAGAEMVAELPWVGSVAREIVRWHHGVPEGESVQHYAAIAAAVIANDYDRMTTHYDGNTALAPRVALQRMLEAWEGRYELEMLRQFVRVVSE
ncbi:MAG: HD domain-containing protein [Planctomycetota bacterium]